MALYCEQKFAGMSLERIDDDGTFAGYASVFETPDLANDQFEKGAFAKSLTRRTATGVRMLYQHDPSRPIGTWDTIREDEVGLYVRGRLTMSTTAASEVHQLLRAGAIDGLSIGFRTVRATNDRVAGVRRIKEADLWEISVVTFPMQPAARVGKVKSTSLSGCFPSKRQVERLLTRQAGLSRRQARLMLEKGFNHLASMQDAAGANHAVLAEHIRNAAATLSARR